MPALPYEQFLAAKAQPVRHLGFSVDDAELNPRLKPFTRDIARWAVHGGRRAIFANFGLHKTNTQLEIMRLIGRHRPESYRLIVMPLGVRQEFMRDGRDHFQHQHSEYGTRRCRYCQRVLNVLTLSPEHKVPLKRGGDLTLANLDLECCQPCNSRKGGLTPGEFIALLEGLKTFPEAARTDILHRLEIAVQLAASRAWSRRQPQPTPQEEII